jgi:hypothetical protein
MGLGVASSSYVLGQGLQHVCELRFVEKIVVECGQLAVHATFFGELSVNTASGEAGNHQGPMRVQ